MNNKQFTNLTAEVIASAYIVSVRELEAEFENTNIMQPDELSKKRRLDNLENAFFNLVVGYEHQLSKECYLSLCNKVSILVGKSFVYRP